MNAPDLFFREDVGPADVDVVREIVASTGFFAPAEVGVAVELVEERLRRGETSGYFFVFAEQGNRAVGYACYGPIACTISSYDLYWIVVHRDRQGAGVGRALLKAAEDRIVRAGGTRIYVETSSREQYEPTRRFYEHFGYRREATLPDFYGPGDGKIVYVRRV